MTLKEICDSLTKAIFEHEYKRLKKAEIKFVKENHSLGGSSDGFRYQGMIFTNLEGKLICKGNFSSLNEQLITAVEMHIKHFHTINFDRIRVHQALALVLRDAKSQQDIRDTLPECAVDVLRMGLRMGKDCPRTRPEAYTLVDNPRSFKQYVELREKIEFYLASKMLY